MIKEVNGLTVEWDTNKNEINKKKHGISFEAAALVLVEDILFVVHTMRSEKIRMISARLATKQERRFYYDSQHPDL